MWFEIIPSFAIIVAALAAPGYAMIGINKLFINNSNRRNMDETYNRFLYRRDDRLTGDPYVANGLESIPDDVE